MGEMMKMSYALRWMVLLSFFGSATSQAIGNAGLTSEVFSGLARRIDSAAIEALPVQHNGRMKPFHTFSRETLMFISGRYQWWGLDTIQTYLGMVTQEGTSDLELIEVRDPELRVQLGYPKDKRFFSVRQLETSSLEAKARPVFSKEEKNSRSLSPAEKKILEAFNQLSLTRALIAGDHFLRALDFSFTPAGSASGEAPHGQDQTSVGLTRDAAVKYLRSIAQGSPEQSVAARDLVALARSAPLPPLMEKFRKTTGLEVVYNKLDPFFFTALVYILAALLIAFSQSRNWLGRKGTFFLLGGAMVLHAAGFGMRVWITGFAPVTNMYGTMLWVAFGVSLFGTVLHFIYDKPIAVSLLSVASGLVLLLTHSMPLILSPDMDPIVAVLRSNYWLTIHVLTITISYAAFTVTMLIGNTALVRSLYVDDDREFRKVYAHLAYRMIQLGVFLISTGIILGGIWADYSWGRFWGWDPKETWALIADLGFLAILHARFVGWLKDFGLLAATTLAYLLVIMAWYGVNFILAAGLHSYGFSSGGATIVAGFVLTQLLLLAAAGMRLRWKKVTQ